LLIGALIIPTIIWLVALAICPFKSPFHISVCHTNGHPHMHSQVHSFCPMLVHGNTFHSCGTPSLLRVPLLLFQQVDCCSGHTQRAFFQSVLCTLTDLSSFHSARDTLNGPSCFLLLLPAHTHGICSFFTWCTLTGLPSFVCCWLVHASRRGVRLLLLHPSILSTFLLSSAPSRNSLR